VGLVDKNALNARTYETMFVRWVGAREESEGKANAEGPICLEYPELFIVLGLRVVLVVLCVYRDS
jgi:hypothetical protein